MAVRLPSFVLVALSAVLLAGSSALAEAGIVRDPDDGTVAIDANAFISDPPLKGPGVVRREQPEGLPPLGDIRTLVIDGTRHGDACGYSHSFYEDFDEATPKVGWLAAIDEDACRFEFTVGSFDGRWRPSPDGGEFTTRESEATRVEEADSARRGFAVPGVWGGSAVPETVAALAEPGRKMVAIGIWQDPDPLPSIDVTKTLTAVRSNVDGNTVVGGACLHDRWWRTATGWENASGGKWNNESCEYAKHRLKGATNARYKNWKFPLCAGQTAYNYYEKLWAKVTTTNQQGEGYYFGIVDTWADGAPCAKLLKWSGWATYPGEYWSW